jgi:hypothetical protein
MSDGSTKPIKYVQIGEEVMTPNGARRVTAVHDNGIKEVWQIDACGSTLLATANHEVMTSKGWIRVDSLIQSCDTVYFYQEVTSWYLKKLALNLKPLFLMARGTIAILKVQTLLIANTLAEQGIGFIEMCGFTTTNRFQMDTTSITLTGTQATTISQILSAFHAKSTGIFTGKKNQMLVALKSNWNILLKLDQKQLHGISQKKDGNGIVNTLKTVWQRFGTNLKSLKKRSSIVFGAGFYFIAKQFAGNFVVQAAKTLNQDSGLVKQVTNTHTMRHVYDLTVEGEHCYYANGILVHNCDALSQGLRVLRDMGMLTIDPDTSYDEYAEDRPVRQNPYAM